MLVDTEHLHYWMQSIRQSPDPIRTMDAFWSGQLKSKEWLIDKLYPHILLIPITIDIFGGWVGTLASMIFQSKIPVKHINSYDIDPTCKPIASMMNRPEEIQGKFKAYTSDMCGMTSVADIIINTSCEHITQEQYDEWLDGMSNESLIILQSNDFYIPEHIRIANSLEEFKEQSKLNEIWSGKLETKLYNRWMIIGYK